MNFLKIYALGLRHIYLISNSLPRIIDLIDSPDIYIPLIVFACLMIITIFLRKLFYKN